MILHSQNGSGKTLAYLLPVLNELYKYRDSHRQDSYELQTSNEEQMFQNADELFYKAKKTKNTEISDMKGAIILSYSKELLNQAYSEARFLDPSMSFL